MKRFIVKISGYIMIIVVLTLSINAVYKMRVQKTALIPDQIDICNFGSSHGVHSYYYEDLESKYTCYNFAMDSQSLSYDERLLDCYKNRLADHAVVIIDISYFACWGIPESKSENFDSKNQRYYSVLSPKYIKEYDWYTDLIVNHLCSLNDGPLKVVKEILRPTTQTKSYPDNWDIVDQSKLREDVKAACQRHIFMEKRDDDGNLIFNEEENQALYDMVRICRAHHATPIFVTVPYLKEYTDEIRNEDPDFYDQFYAWIYQLSAELGVEYYDYSLDERFIHDYSLFYNGDHMNSYGAKKFTKILYDEVIKYHTRKLQIMSAKY